MADWVWKGVYPEVFGHSQQLSLNKFFDPTTPSMRKGRDGGKREKKKKGGKKGKKKEETDENSGHYVVCQQSTARTPTAETPHARAKIVDILCPNLRKVGYFGAILCRKKVWTKMFRVSRSDIDY